MKSTLSHSRTSSDTNSESTTKTENNCKPNHRENDEILTDFNNQSNSESSFITIDEDKEDSLSEFDVGSIQSDGYISESAIEDDGVADHLLSDSLKAQKDELINRLHETISSVKLTSNKQNIPVDDTQPVTPQDEPNSKTLCYDTTFPSGTNDIIPPEELPPVDRTQDIPIPDVDVTEDQSDNIARIRNTSDISLPEGTLIITESISKKSVCGTSEVNEVNDTSFSHFNDSNISTSTVAAFEQKMPHDSPHHETLPPAVRILQNQNRDSEPEANAVSSKCEEAYASLSQVLANETLGHIPTKELLEAIDNQLESNLDKDKQMLESMRSEVDYDCKSFLSLDNDDPLDNLLLSTKTDILEDTIVANDTVITIDSNENTLKCRDNNESQKEATSPKKVDNVESKVSVIVTVRNIPKKQDDELDWFDSDDDELGGTIINVEEDEEKLLASDDEQNGKVGTKSGLKKFESQDPEENKDINDPKWESLKKCKTEIDFFKAIRTRWKNLSKPNPREDLTYHSKRRIINQSSHMFACKNEYGKRPRSPVNNELNPKIARRESCTYLFDTNIKNLMKNADTELNRIDFEKRLRLDELAAKQMREKKEATANRQKFHYFHNMRLRQIRETEDLLARFKYKWLCVMEGTKQKIAALNEASREVRQVFEFYYCDEISRGEVDMSLTEIEKREIIELENMLDAYNDFYQPTSD